MANDIQELLKNLQVVLDEEPDVYPDFRRSTLRKAMKWLSYYHNKEGDSDDLRLHDS